MRRVSMSVLAGIVCMVFQGISGPAMSQTRRVYDLPGDQCPGYFKALGKFHADNLMLIVGSSGSICANQGATVIESLNNVLRYTRNRNCYSLEYWFSSTQSEWRDLETKTRREVAEAVRAACNRVREDRVRKESADSAARNAATQQPVTDPKEDTNKIQREQALAAADRAAVHAQQGRYQKAVELYQQAIDIHFKLGDSRAGDALISKRVNAQCQLDVSVAQKTINKADTIAAWRMAESSCEYVPTSLALVKSQLRAAGDRDQMDGCVLLGEPVPVDCSDESGGKNCKCLNIENNCTKTITAKWRASGASPGSKEIPKGKAFRGACTGNRSQSIEYLGHTSR